MKLTKSIEARAKKLFKENSFNKLYVNKKGEFFTNPNLAKLSVKDPEKELMELSRERFADKASAGASASKSSAGKEPAGGETVPSGKGSGKEDEPKK